MGAFALADHSRDSALLVSLSSGPYTVQVSGANGTSGVALVESTKSRQPPAAPNPWRRQFKASQRRVKGEVRPLSCPPLRQPNVT